MKFMAFDNTKERVQLLKLENAIDGTVMLLAVDECGKKIESGILLTINTDGTITLASGVNNCCGLKLDANQRVVVQKDVCIS